MRLRWVRLGAVCWTLTGLYFAVEVVVAAAWPEPYSFAANTISDLGMVGCGEIVQLGGRPVSVCSPRHPLMNAAFVAVGVLTAAGAVLTHGTWPAPRTATVALVFVVLAGAGGVLVGAGPADVQLGVHAAGALLQVPGATAPLLLGFVVRRQRPVVGGFSVACGVVGTLASALFLAQVTLGLDVGTVERLAIWPLTIWTTVVGAALLRSPGAHSASR